MIPQINGGPNKQGGWKFGPTVQQLALIQKIPISITAANTSWI